MLSLDVLGAVNFEVDVESFLLLLLYGILLREAEVWFRFVETEVCSNNTWISKRQTREGPPRKRNVYIPSAEPSPFSLSSCRTLSSSLDMPDMNSSSESMLSVVSGVGGAASAAAEAAILLLDLVACLSEDAIASAAFLFLGWEEIVSTVGVVGGGLVGRDEILGM